MHDTDKPHPQSALKRILRSAWTTFRVLCFTLGLLVMVLFASAAVSGEVKVGEAGWLGDFALIASVKLGGSGAVVMFSYFDLSKER